MRLLKPLKTAGLTVLGAVPFTLGMLAGAVCGAAVWAAAAAMLGWHDGYGPWRGARRGSAQ